MTRYMDTYKQDSNPEHQVKEFYSDLKFPGPYSIEDLKFYDQNLINPYLKFYDNAIQGCKTVLDIGCGSGFIVNFLARRNPTIKFDAVDFGDGIDYARQFSNNNAITNVVYHKENFLDWQAPASYDLIICNGVLHHIPKYQQAVEKIKNLSDDKIAIGIYNSYGKFLKKFLKINYINQILYADQEQCPFELTFNDREFRNLFKGFDLSNTYPGYKTHLIDLCNLVNYSNGGLTLYLFNTKKNV